MWPQYQVDSVSPHEKKKKKKKDHILCSLSSYRSMLMSYCLTKKLSKRSRGLVEKLIVAQTVENSQYFKEP
jgi:hypothetical protein